ncbi:MAG: LCP family protein [Oscillospiraceae bacterium]|nr:LCP family protein [Oscillospiraceae bacterium]
MHCNKDMSYSYYKRRGPRAGSTAIPFMITVLISLIVFGGVALYFYNKITVKTDELPMMQSATTSISDADIKTTLFILDPDEPDRQTAIMMLRFDPVRKAMFCVGVPLDLQVSYEGRNMSVGACYTDYKPEALKTAISELLEQPIDYYIQMDSEGFQTMVNLIGNVSYVVPIKDDGLRPSEAAVLLDNKQLETLLTSNNYSSEEERSTVIGLSIAQLLNQCIGDDNAHGNGAVDGGARVARNLDSYFSAVINNVTTDVTAMDFSDHRHAISYVFEYAQAPARGIGIMCSMSDEGAVVPHPVFLDNLKIMFYQSTTGSHSSKSEE